MNNNNHTYLQCLNVFFLSVMLITHPPNLFARTSSTKQTRFLFILLSSGITHGPRNSKDFHMGSTVNQRTFVARTSGVRLEGRRGLCLQLSALYSHPLRGA